MLSLSLFLVKYSKDLKRIQCDGIVGGGFTLAGYFAVEEFNAKEPERFAWDIGYLEVPGQVTVVQVVVVESTINFPP